MGSHYYAQHAVALKAELGEALSREDLRQLHRKSGWRHGIVAVRQFAILGLATWGLIHFEHPLIWIPLALVQGFTIFNFTILLHEVVHHTVFERPIRGRSGCSGYSTRFRAASPPVGLTLVVTRRWRGSSGVATGAPR